MIGVYNLQDGLKLIIRNYYDGTLHVTYETPEAFGQVQKLCVEGSTLSFTLPLETPVEAVLTVEGETYTGTLGGAAVSGAVAAITPADDRIDKCTHKKRALIMYCTITKNTERIAKAFEESFQSYGWAVDLVRITNSSKLSVNYNDYDVVCLGSPIVAGSPLMCVQKRFSPGGGSSLEEDITKNAEAGLSFNAGGVGLRGPGGPGGPGGGPDGGPGGPGGPEGMGSPGGASWAGGPTKHGVYNPLGIIFTTYGGGCSGPEEANGTLALLRLYLTQKNCKVIGTFACCGKEYGPAGIDDGDKPIVMGPAKLEPPVYYKDGSGSYHAGSFFFHTHMNSKPNARDIMKAKALVADIVEDYFYSYDGLRKEIASEYVSIS